MCSPTQERKPTNGISGCHESATGVENAGPITDPTEPKSEKSLLKPNS